MRNFMMLLTGIFLCTSFVLKSVKAGYQLEIMFFDYQNPSHLCAECGDNGQIACCDDIERTADCLSVGPQGCDTRMRWTRRTFGTPNTTAAIAQDFEGGTPGFISDGRFDVHAQYLGPGLTNPLVLLGESWPGSIQFYVEVLDAREPGTTQLRGPEIDRIVVDISLSVGEDFTARTAYTGLYGLAMLDLNFRVSCSETYFGEDCAIKCTGVSGQSECNDEGELRCIGNRNQSTGCVQCVSGYRGDSCDEPDCSAEPCLNGGTCTENGSQKECQCPQGFKGSRCERYITTVPSEPTTDPKTAPTEGTTAITTSKATQTTSATQPPEDNAALIGGVVGGLAALFLIVIILLLMTIVLVVAMRSRRASKLDIQVTVNGGGGVENPNYMLQDIKIPNQAAATANSYTETTANTPGPEHRFDNPLYDANNPNDYSDPWDTVKKPSKSVNKAAPSHSSMDPVQSSSHHKTDQEEPPVYAVAHKPSQSSFTQSPTESDEDQDTYARTNHSLHSKYKQHKYEYIDHTPPGKESSSAQPVYHYADANPPKLSPPVYDSTETPFEGSKGAYDYARLNPPPAYTNTTPGNITREASEHYDLGQ